MDPVIIVLACVAAFILFKLFTVLGTRTGHEHQPSDLEPVRSRPTEAEIPRDETFTETDPAPTPLREPTPLAKTLQDADPDFDEIRFISGARNAYELIVESFASGDLRSIKDYLDSSVYETFKRVTAMREEASHTIDLKFVGIEKATLVETRVEKGRLFATAEFSSNQVRATRDKDQNVVDGDPVRIDLVKDRWTFSRKYPETNPNWILVATGGGA